MKDIQNLFDKNNQDSTQKKSVQISVLSSGINSGQHSISNNERDASKDNEI